MPGVDTYLTDFVQDPPIYDAKVLQDLHFRRGNFTPDIIIVTRPAFAITTELKSNPKLVPAGRTDIVSGSGFNPWPKDIDRPHLEKGKKRTVAFNATFTRWKQYDKHKYDMNTMAFAMGPGERRNNK